MLDSTFTDSNSSKNLDAAKLVLLGTICGDFIGSCRERHPIKQTDFNLINRFCRFTDDTVCSIAVADSLMHGYPFDKSLRHWCRKYRFAGYGGQFRNWIKSDMGAYNSFGNGSAMRVSPVGAYANDIDRCLLLAKQSAEVTHNHPEGVKGAQAVAAAIFYALRGKTKSEIKDYIEHTFGYNLSRRYADIQPWYTFDVTCQRSVPESIIAFLESTDYESAIRLAVAYGGDADTMAAIAGGIAAAYYGEIPQYIIDKCSESLTDEILRIVDDFGSHISHISHP